MRYPPWEALSSGISLPLRHCCHVRVDSLAGESTPLWIEAFRRLRHNRLAMIALVVMAIYVTFGFLDSISWSDTRNAEPRSIVDRVFERTRERTYSAPFARLDHW